MEAENTLQVKQLADAYVTNLKQANQKTRTDRWFPTHDDDVVQKVRWFHQEMGKLFDQVR